MGTSEPEQPYRSPYAELVRQTRSERTRQCFEYLDDTRHALDPLHTVPESLAGELPPVSTKQPFTGSENMIPTAAEKLRLDIHLGDIARAGNNVAQAIMDECERRSLLWVSTDPAKEGKASRVTALADIVVTGKDTSRPMVDPHDGRVGVGRWSFSDDSDPWFAVHWTEGSCVRLAVPYWSSIQHHPGAFAAMVESVLIHRAWSDLAEWRRVFAAFGAIHGEMKTVHPTVLDERD